jgi:WD40 repeat protein
MKHSGTTTVTRGFVQVGDVASGRRQTLRRPNLQRHAYWVASVAFDAAGRLMASSSGDRTIILWEAPGSVMRYRCWLVHHLPRPHQVVAASPTSSV